MLTLFSATTWVTSDSSRFGRRPPAGSISGRSAGPAFPFDFDHPGRLALAHDCLTVAQVDSDALASGDESDDRVTRNRVAALAEADQQVPYPLTELRPGAPDSAAGPWAGVPAGHRRPRRASKRPAARYRPVADRGVEIIQVVETCTPSQSRGSDPGRRHRDWSGQAPQLLSSESRRGRCSRRAPGA